MPAPFSILLLQSFLQTHLLETYGQSIWQVCLLWLDLSCCPGLTRQREGVQGRFAPLSTEHQLDIFESQCLITMFETPLTTTVLSIFSKSQQRLHLEYCQNLLSCLLLDVGHHQQLFEPWLPLQLGNSHWLGSLMKLEILRNFCLTSRCSGRNDWSRRPSSQESDCPTEYSTTSEPPPTFNRWMSTLTSTMTTPLTTMKKRETMILKAKLEEKGECELA